MRQKTGFSVVEMRSENVVIVSEKEGSDLGNEGSDLGIPWPNGPPSSDCPVGWHTDDAPRRHRVRTPEVQGISEALPGLSAGGLQRQIGPLT